MGSVASDVGNFVSDTVSSVGDIGQSVIDAGSDIVESVGSGVSDAAQSVSDAFAQIDPGPAIGEAGAAVDQVVNDVIPGGWYMVAAVAATVASMGTVNLEGEALAAGTAGEVVAATTAGEAVTAGVAATEGVAAAGATTAAASSGSAAAQAALQSAATGALKGAAIGAAKSAITGGDIFDGAVNGALTGAIGGGVGSYASGLTAGTDLADYAKTVGAVAGGTAGGATGAALSGRDPLTGALIGGISGGTSSLASNLMPTDVNPAITSGALGAAKAALTGGDPVTGALSAAGSSLVGQGVGAGYDAAKSGLDSVTPPTQTADITQDPNYKAAIEAGFNPDEAKALAQGALDPTLPAYAPLASNGSVTVTSANDFQAPTTPLVRAPEETGTTTVTNSDGSKTTYDKVTGDEISTEPAPSPVDPLDLILYGDSASSNTNPVTTPSNLPSNTTNETGSQTPTTGNLPSTSNTSGSGAVADSTGTGNITTGAGTGLGSSGTGAGTGSGSGGGAGGIGLGLGALGMGTGSYRPTTSATSNYAQDVTDGLTNLTPGLTKPMDYNLAGLSHYATGGSTTSKSSSLFDDKGNYNYGNLSDTPLTAALTKHNVGYTLTGLPSKAQGGLIEEHNPQFYSEGGASMANRYVTGAGDGTSDSVPAMLANGEFVIPADIVSSLGNGSNDSGAKILDEFLRVIREHKKKHDVRRLPPNSKGPLSYLTDAKRKVKK